jgi:aspartate aminotransferase
MLRRVLVTLPRQQQRQQCFSVVNRMYSTGGIWEHVEPQGLDAIKQLTIAFQQDTTPTKILLGEGVYRDENGKPVVLKAVREAEKKIYEQNVDHEYAAVTGVQSFIDAAQKLALGENNTALKEGRVAGVQTISGTGGLRLGAAFLKKFAPKDSKVYMPDPTWGNHPAIFKAAGFDEIKSYRYYDKKTGGLDLEGVLADLKAAPEKSIILLHVCAHNPTGVDPTPAQWKKISEVCKERGHILFFDLAYQAFASGNAAQDANAVRTFIEDGHKPLVVQSFAKNFGLYGERIGALSAVCATKQEAAAVSSQFAIIVRAMYSNPPVYGARLVATILNDPQLKAQWEKDVKVMADRIIKCRAELVKALKAAGSTRDWTHITNQIGMFAFSGLTGEQVDKLKNDYHIYMTRDGRMSISGLNEKNIPVVAKAIYEVTK